MSENVALQGQKPYQGVVLLLFPFGDEVHTEDAMLANCFIYRTEFILLLSFSLVLLKIFFQKYCTFKKMQDYYRRSRREPYTIE